MPLRNINYMALYKIFQGQGYNGKVKGQIKVKLWWCTTTPHNQYPYQIWTSYTLRFPRYSMDKIFQGQGHYNKVKSQIKSNYDTAQLHPLTNVPTKYELPTLYGSRDIAQARFLSSRSLRQGQRSNQGQTMMLQTYTPQPMYLPSINTQPLIVPEI